MITHCTECDTYFRVSIEQLKTASGQVKCGCCGTVFNAVESLLESSADTIHDQESSIPVGRGILSDKKDSDADQAVEDLAHDQTEVDLDIDAVTDEDNEDLSQDEIEDPDQEEVAVEEETTTQDDGIFSDHTQNDPIFTDDAEELFASDPLDLELDHDLGLAKKQSNSAWFITSFLLVMLLVFQLIKDNTEMLLAQFPALHMLCKIAECPEDEQVHDVSAVNLISRDVREHPQFKEVLLVNATMMNGSKQYQPFPRIQLDLFNSDGKAVGSREFAPHEYLDDSVDPEVGMKPQQPVHIVLEVLGSGKDTSSFEFKFL